MLAKLHATLIKSAPQALKIPLQFVPFAVKKQLIEQVMNWQFNQAIQEGDLDFLEGKWLKIEVYDLNLIWFITLENQKLKVSPQAQADVSFSANTNELILIMARKVDPDTLFFQRKLLIEGDTELGLYVKNLMDSVDFDAIPTALRVPLTQLAHFIELGQKPALTQNTASTPPYLTSKP